VGRRPIQRQDDIDGRFGSNLPDPTALTYQALAATPKEERKIKKAACYLFADFAFITLGCLPKAPKQLGPCPTGGSFMIEGKLKLMTVEGTGRQFVAETPSGHTILMDDAQGQTGPKPIELALLALGGCTAFDVIGILRKKRQVVTGYEVEVRAEQREEPPNYFTHVAIKHRLHGTIEPEAVKRAIELSETKYCSVGAMIAKTAKIDSTFEIVAEPASAGITGTRQ
jgi:putative redox protein